MSEQIKYTTEEEAYKVIKDFLLSAMSDEELDKDNFDYYYPDFSHASELLEELVSIDYFRGEDAVKAEKLEAGVLDLIQSNKVSDNTTSDVDSVESDEAAEDKPFIYILGVLNTQGYDQDSFTSEILNISQFCNSPYAALKSFVLDGGLGFCNASDAEQVLANLDRCSISEPIEDSCDTIADSVPESDIAEAEDLCIEDTPSAESEELEEPDMGVKVEGNVEREESDSVHGPDSNTITIVTEPIDNASNANEEKDSTEAMEKLAHAVADICGKLFTQQSNSEN